MVLTSAKITQRGEPQAVREGSKRPRFFDDVGELRVHVSTSSPTSLIGQLHRPRVLDTSRALTQASHEALGGGARHSPLVVDPLPEEAPSRSKPCVWRGRLCQLTLTLCLCCLKQGHSSNISQSMGQRLADESEMGEWMYARLEDELASTTQDQGGQFSRSVSLGTDHPVGSSNWGRLSRRSAVGCVQCAS